jgi:N-acetylglutamate synthase-like GNAT family acetyltransferase
MPRRMAPTEDMGPVHALMTVAFASMEGRIDPPSSLHLMGLDDLAIEAARAELWVIDGAEGPLACVILTPRADTLYLGKLAVTHVARGQGLARQMVELAVARAKALGLPTVSLQTRMELVENHAAFTALGFEMTGATAHPGYDRPTSLSFRMSV